MTARRRSAGQDGRMAPGQAGRAGMIRAHAAWRQKMPGTTGATKRPVNQSPNAKVLGTAALAAAPRAGLRKPLADLRQPREQIQAALGALFGAC